MPYLVVSLAALLAGPLAGARLERAPRLKAGLEWVVVVGLLLLVGLHIIPEAVELASYWVLFAAAASFFATLGLERFGNKARASAAVVLGAGLLALGFHSALDGIALGGSEGPGASHLLAPAVVLHRIPTSLALWWLVQRSLGALWAYAVLAADGAATVLGFFLGERLLAGASPLLVGVFQGVIAGSLAHVALHVRAGGHGHRHDARAAPSVPAR